MLQQPINKRRIFHPCVYICICIPAGSVSHSESAQHPQHNRLPLGEEVSIPTVMRPCGPTRQPFPGLAVTAVCPPRPPRLVPKPSRPYCQYPSAGPAALGHGVSRWPELHGSLSPQSPHDPALTRTIGEIGMKAVTCLRATVPTAFVHTSHSARESRFLHPAPSHPLTSHRAGSRPGSSRRSLPRGG